MSYRTKVLKYILSLAWIYLCIFMMILMMVVETLIIVPIAVIIGLIINRDSKWNKYLLTKYFYKQLS
ncbi:MAG: hypothetical protein PHT40_03385 [Patescibacteria group bacterium]|nr:hypothetical protein [Patescibacteria group bacterium]